jgi:hypothetical protein
MERDFLTTCPFFQKTAHCVRTLKNSLSDRECFFFFFRYILDTKSRVFFISDFKNVIPRSKIFHFDLLKRYMTAFCPVLRSWSRKEPDFCYRSQSYNRYSQVSAPAPGFGPN